MLEVLVNDRFGKKIRVKCNPDDSVDDLKRVLAVMIGSRADRLRLQKGSSILKDPVALEDYEIHDGTALELYYT
eukprot:ANDGO_02470.mRNA.1 hypothetical protein